MTPPDEIYVPPGALRDAKEVLYGKEMEDARYYQEIERRWPIMVWREAIRQAIAAPEPPRHAVSRQFSLFGTSE